MRCHVIEFFFFILMQINIMVLVFNVKQEPIYRAGGGSGCVSQIHLPICNKQVVCLREKCPNHTHLNIDWKLMYYFLGWHNIACTVHHYGSVYTCKWCSKNILFERKRVINRF